MPEDTAEQAPEAPKSTEPEPRAPDVADEEDLDVVLERVAPRRSGGMGWLGWLLIVVVVLGAAGWFGNQYFEQQRQEAEQARKDRETTYMGQRGEIMAKVERAAKDASAGHIDAAVDVLEAAQVQWGQLAQGAQAQGDADVADDATRQKAALSDALEGLETDRGEAGKLAQQSAELEAQLKALQAKQDELNARVRDRILQLADEAPATSEETQAPGNAEPTKPDESQPEQTQPAAEPAPAAEAPR